MIKILVQNYLDLIHYLFYFLIEVNHLIYYNIIIRLGRVLSTCNHNGRHNTELIGA